MARPRAQVGDPTSGQIRAGASNIGTTIGFNQVDAPRTTGLDGLMQSLSAFGTAAEKLLVNRQERKDKANLEEGLALWQQNRKDFQVAVKEGVIEPGANPWLLHGYRTAEARAAGLEYGFALQKAVLDDMRIRRTDNPEELGAFVNDFTKNYMEERGLADLDPILAMEHLEPAILGAQNEIFREHENRRRQERVEEYEQMASAELNHLFDTALMRGTPAAELVAGFSARLSEMAANSFPGAQVNVMAAKIIAQAAEDYNNPAFLDLLDHIETGNGPIGKIAAVRAIRGESQQRLLQRQITMENREYTLMERSRSENARATMESFINTYKKEGSKILTEDLVSLSGRLGNESPEALHDINRLRTILSTAEETQKDNPEVYKNLIASMHRNPQGFNHEAILSAMERGELRAETGRTLLGELRTVQKSYDHPFFDGDVWGATIGSVRRRFGVSDNMEFTDEAILRLQQADLVEARLRIEMFDWVNANPEASQRDFILESRERAERLMEVFPPPVMPNTTESMQTINKLRGDLRDERGVGKQGSRLAPDEAKQYAAAEARKYPEFGNMGPALVLAVMGTESNFNSTAVSNKGARGLMQVMPQTFYDEGGRNLEDPRENVAIGVKYLAKQLRTFNGNLPLALAAYNAGPGAVKKYGNKVPPYPETQAYVRKVLSALQTYANYEG